MGAVPRHAGVDGCRAGWVVALGPAGPGGGDHGHHGGAEGEVAVGGVTVGDGPRLRVVADFDEALASVDGIVAVDMPIGLPEPGRRRACDAEARRALGPRRSSVFPAPSRPALDATSFAEVTGLSLQAWNLVPKVREVDRAWEPRVREVSPELAFTVLTGAPMRHPKRRPAGRAERLAALGLRAVPRVRGAAPDDVLDALACLGAAERIAAGTALALGDGTVDARGRPMTIYA
jgi:predicted RNase H-like nuclease